MTVFWRDVGWCHQANKGGRGFARSRGVAADRKISSPSHPVIRISIVAARQEDLHTLLDCSSPESPSPSFSTATPLPPRHYRVRSAVFASLALHGLAQPPAPHGHLARMLGRLHRTQASARLLGGRATPPRRRSGVSARAVFASPALGGPSSRLRLAHAPTSPVCMEEGGGAVQRGPTYPDGGAGVRQCRILFVWWWLMSCSGRRSNLYS